MTIDTKALRAQCEAATALRETLAANPTTVLALLDENEMLESYKYERDRFRQQLDIATELLDSRNKQLAAMTAARDEACRIAQALVDSNEHGLPFTDADIAALINASRKP